MAYKTIDETFWTDPDNKKGLTPKEKLLALYLITNPHTHYSGIYYLPFTFIEDETGLGRKEINKFLSEHSKFAAYDSKCEVIWIKNMAEYQMKQGNKENLVKGIAVHLDTLHKTFLIMGFLGRYSSLAIPFTIPCGWDTQPIAESGEGTGEGTGEGGEAQSGLMPDTSPPEDSELILGEFKNVKLKDSAYKKLKLLYSEKITNEYIEKLSGYLKAKGKKYQDYYAALLNWLRKDGIMPLSLCTRESPMPPGEKDRRRWRHPETKEVTHKDTGRTVRKCLHCNSIFEGT